MPEIQPGQIYRSLSNRHHPCDGPTRIRVVSRGPGYPAYGWSKVLVETVLPDGRGVRQRAIEATQLHDSPLTRDGQPRRTGYVLEVTHG
jgi:hypothetical protein